MIWGLNSLFHKANALFKEEDYVLSESILFTQISIAHCHFRPSMGFMT
jgi:hypothetical protein